LIILYQCTCTRRIELEYSLSMRDIGIEFMFIVHGCKIGPEYVPIAYLYKQIGS
jgi:hypothetical protein